jgi:formate dehydrogenase subunit gamma
MADNAARAGLLVRHEQRDRILHWLVVLAFLCAAVSGLALFHPSLYWLTGLMGGGTWSALLHPFVGLAMALGFYLFARPLWQENQLEPRDRAWLKGIWDVVDGREDRLPEVGKYNGGQKVLYLVLVACVAILALTGLVIWRRYFAGFLPIGAVRLGALLHAFTAFVLVAGIIVHVAAAVWIKGSVAAMMRGTVTPGWAFKHHRAWFRQMIRPGGGR